MASKRILKELKDTRSSFPLFHLSSVPLRLCCSMAKLGFTAVLFLLVIHFAFASDTPELSAAPAPESGDTPSLVLAPSPVGSPNISPLPASPPSPVALSPSDQSPNGSPTSSPSPAPGKSEINHINVPGEEDKESVGGMRGFKKARIVVVVVAAASLVWFAAMVDSEISVRLLGEEGGTVRREISEWLTVVLPTRAVTHCGIVSGRVSADVEEMPRIPPGRNSRPFLARDMHGPRIYDLKYNRRMWGLRPKQTITGLKRFFQEHGLQPGDRITMYKEEGNEVMLMGKLISPLYVIDFERVNEVAGR